MDVASMRKVYAQHNGEFNQNNLQSKNPFELFSLWFKDAVNNFAQDKDHEANAMTLATADKNGKPTARMVLLKGFDENGFQFYTNYRSRKAQNIKENPWVVLVLYWPNLCRSVRIEGRAVKLPSEKSEQYFHSRPKESQIGAHISTNQSSYLDDYGKLLKKVDEKKVEYANKDVPKPDFWGGYNVIPNRIEFWQGRSDRLHSRVCFYRNEEIPDSVNELKTGENGWMYQMLQP